MAEMEFATNKHYRINGNYAEYVHPENE